MAATEIMEAPPALPDLPTIAPEHAVRQFAFYYFGIAATPLQTALLPRN